MGKAAKGSRKGKKAWRANIRTDDIDEFYEKQTRDAHAGAAAIPSLPSDSLFFVDKPASASASTSAAADPAPQGPTTTLSCPLRPPLLVLGAGNLLVQRLEIS
jgi:nucleolar protein 53